MLAWKDVWVKVHGGRRGTSATRPAILEGISGYAESGQVLAVMAPSGSGKSTLLDALAGRLGSNMRRTGDILINGRKQVLAFGTSAYVTQDDSLMTTLTIKEAVYYSALLQLPDAMPKAEKLDRAEMAIKMMGLQDYVDTTIGGRTTTGISGGQRRRVSICMEILTRPRLLFLDEPTSGLDSAASYHVMSYLVALAREEQTTVVASIHQPSGNVFDLFDNLCLLSSGKLVYFGLAPDAITFFASNGFPCPSMRNPSDHYLATINKDFELRTEEKLKTEKAINFLAESYKSSEVYQQVQTRVSMMHCHEGQELERGSQAKFVTQTLVLTRRSFVNMYRDPGYYKLRLVVHVGVSICLGTIFHHLDTSYDSIQARAAFLAFVGGFLTFMSIGGFPSFVEDMKIFGRERLNGHYGVAAFVISNTLSSLPYLFIISVIPGAMAYYISGLRREFDHYIYFALLLFSGITVVESLMMIVASLVPDFLMGIITGAGILGIMMLNSGFLRLPNDIPKPIWKYPLHYIDFGTYANQGFYRNEFEGLVFYRYQNGARQIITGEDVLTDVLQIRIDFSKWVYLAILLGMVLIYRVIFFAIIKVAEFRKNSRRTNS
ncbi:ABC transporter G family member 1-like [Silene latifolia]|uniref:ABC transporter G family member 1-like n=1 Tax=Silene latifolia TaxID=37657 RepID=UPI003D77598C